MSEEKKELNPSEYFAIVKGRKQTVTDEDLSKIYDNCLELLNKYNLTGQTSAMRKLLFHLESIEKERELVKMGISTFIYRDDIEEYIDDVANDIVKLINIEGYEREIPDEIVAVVKQVKDKFDQLYVLYTDYTGKEAKRIEKERMEKDPILFGTFEDPSAKAVIDRFYFLGDWEDEYCDLTLDKMVNEVKTSKQRDIVRTISTPEDIAELKEQLNQLVAVNNVFRLEPEKKKGFFKNIQSFLGGGKK